MSLITEPVIGRNNQIQNIRSSYQPDERVKERFKQMRKDFQIAHNIRNQTYEEFNDRDLIEYMNESQRKFNSYVPPRSENPDESWKAQTVRPLTRNKVISIAAHVTANVMYPNIIAQNDKDEEDRDAADVMKDLMQWSNEQSKYEKTFVYGIISALVNPAVILHTGYADIPRIVKRTQADGTWTPEMIRDEAYSGFFNSVIPVDELYIGDVYEHEIQKQPFLIWKRVIPYEAARAKYQGNPLFDEYVKPGLKIFYVDEQDTFYEQYDEDQTSHLVEDIVFFHRGADLELNIVNGVMLTDPDQPMRRYDKMYPFAKSGYELIDEGRFFYYKSLVDKLRDDQDVLDTLYNMVIDGSFLNLMPPLAAYGDEEMDTAVIVPGMVTTFSPEARIEPISVGNDLNAGIAALREVEASASESSQDPMQSGLELPGAQTAFEISRLEQNARTILGLFGKMVGFLVEDFGKLRLNDVLQYMTVGEVMETTSSNNRMKFHNFVITDKMVRGKKRTRKIEFEPMDEIVNEGDLEAREFDLLAREGDLDSDVQIVQVNPSVFRRMKFLVHISPEFSPAQSEAVQRALKLEEFDRLIPLPFIDQEQITRDLLLGSYDATSDDPDKYIRQQSPMQIVQGEAGATTGRMIQQLTGTPEMNVNQLAG